MHQLMVKKTQRMATWTVTKKNKGVTKKTYEFLVQTMVTAWLREAMRGYIWRLEMEDYILPRKDKALKEF